MTITISHTAYWELFRETIPIKQDSSCSLNGFETTWEYPKQLGKGYWQEIQLRQGLELAIANYHLHDHLIMQLPERKHPLEYSFYISGEYKAQSGSIVAGQYFLCGSGTAPMEVSEYLATEKIIEINVHIEPALFLTFWGNPSGSVPAELQHLLKHSGQEYYTRSQTTTTAMQMVLQQVLQCPFQGITKQMYLESKVWELMALLLEQDLKMQQQKCVWSLKPDDVDRVYHAREILLRQLDNPPSLIELARQVGLNDCTLKRGFRQVFGKTAFGYLHDYRLEQAQKLLEDRRLNISEIAQTIGFANRSYFAAAFRKKFGVTPREYLSRYKNSA